MSARLESEAIRGRLNRRGIPATLEQANILRRAEKTLSRWYEQECGDSDDYASWAIERDETTGIPYRVTYPHKGEKSRRTRIPDMERGAIRRINAVCHAITMGASGRYDALPVPKPIPVYFYVQTDPRGCCLYLGTEPLTDRNYSTVGVACCL